MDLHELDLIAVKAHALSFQAKDLLDFVTYLKYTIDVDYQSGKEDWDKTSPELEEALKHKIEQFIKLCTFAATDMVQHLESVTTEKEKDEVRTTPEATESDDKKPVQEPTGESE